MTEDFLHRFDIITVRLEEGRHIAGSVPGKPFDGELFFGLLEGYEPDRMRRPNMGIDH